MSFVPGTDGILSLDNNSGVLTNYSNDTSKFNYKITVANGEFATFGQGWQATVGRRKFSGSMDIRPQTGASGLHNVLMGYLHPGAGVAHGTKTLRWQFPNASAGSFQLDGEIMPDEYTGSDQNAEGDGTPAMHSFPFKFQIEPTYTLIS